MLAQVAYGDLVLRSFTDLDILIQSRDLPQVIAVLAENHYFPSPQLSWLSPAALVRWTGEMSYVSTNEVSVDLHWRLTPPHYTVQLDPAILWRSVTSVSLAGAQIPALMPEALLVLLSVHGAKHCWEALGWLADIAWLVAAKPGIDWSHALALADESSCARPLLLAASLVHQVFGTTLPRFISERVAADRALPALRQHVIARHQSGTMESPRTPELLRFAAMLAPAKATIIRHVAGLLLNPTEIDWTTRQLPEGLFGFYAPLRVVRLAGKYLNRG